MTGKTVWIFNHYAVPPDAAGPTRHFDLAQYLIRKGHKVCIFASAFDHVTRSLNRLDGNEKVKSETVEGVPFVWVRTYPYGKNDWRRIINMLEFAWAVIRRGVGHLKERPDVIIGSSMHPFAVVAAWLLAKKYRSKFIFEVRDLWPQTAIDMGKMKPKGVMARGLYAWEKFMCQKSDKIIVVMPNAVNYITGLGVPAHKVAWIPNGVNLDRFNNTQPLPEGLETVFKTAGNKFVVMYTGAHGPANGLDQLIAAAELISGKDSDIHFISVGDGPEKGRLKEKAQSLRLRNISFIDSVPKRLISSVLLKADLLVHCLLPLDVFRHGLSPNKLFDYFASGKPVVSCVRGLENLLRESGAGWSVPPNDPDALAKAILMVKKASSEERQNLGQGGLNYLKNNYSIDVTGEKINKVINSL